MKKHRKHLRMRGHKRSSMPQRQAKARFGRMMFKARMVWDFVSITHEPARYAFYLQYPAVLRDQFSLTLLCWYIRDMPQGERRERLSYYRDQLILQRRTS